MGTGADPRRRAGRFGWHRGSDRAGVPDRPVDRRPLPGCAVGGRDAVLDRAPSQNRLAGVAPGTEQPIHSPAGRRADGSGRGRPAVGPSGSSGSPGHSGPTGGSDQSGCSAAFHGRGPLRGRRGPAGVGRGSTCGRSGDETHGPATRRDPAGGVAATDAGVVQGVVVRGVEVPRLGGPGGCVAGDLVAGVPTGFGRAGSALARGAGSARGAVRPGPDLGAVGAGLWSPPVDRAEPTGVVAHIVASISNLWQRR